MFLMPLFTNFRNQYLRFWGEILTAKVDVALSGAAPHDRDLQRSAESTPQPPAAPSCPPAGALGRDDNCTFII